MRRSIGFSLRRKGSYAVVDRRSAERLENYIGRALDTLADPRPRSSAHSVRQQHAEHRVYHRPFCRRIFIVAVEVVPNEILERIHLTHLACFGVDEVDTLRRQLGSKLAADR